MDEAEGGRKALDFDEKNFLFEWLVENNKSLTRKNKELLVENLKFRARVEELEKISFIDPTTGLYNRWYLQPRLVEEFSRARRGGCSLSCLFIDIDDFKAVNDRYGHFVGDKVLRDTAALLRGHCRREDVLIRFGGDEFVMLLSSSGQRAARAAAERIRGRILSHALSAEDPQLTLSVSIGVSTLRKDHIATSRDPWELVWTADGAMHLARQKGAGQVHWLDCHGYREKAECGERAAS
jgi:diguanylate cyclase (GGDEF)-like protein